MNNTDPSTSVAFLLAPAPPSDGTCVQKVPSQEVQEKAAQELSPTPAQRRAAPPKTTLPTVPGYVFLSELGRGGMGVVYLARQERLNRLVALKMILGGGHADADSLARFRMEAEVISQLRHPNIVQIYEMGESAGHAYFSMEFLPDGSLFKRQQEHPLVPREAAAMIRTLALAMQAVHDKGILHRDLKPANVLLLSNEECRRMNEQAEKKSSDIGHSSFDIPKITDFGLAKRVAAEGMTQSGVILGTPEYMAPEQATGAAAQIGPAVDIYALGAMLYEFLAGRPPFKGYTPMETVLQVVTEEVFPPSRLQPKTPRELETICLKCLQKDPAKRYATARDLADDLQRFLEGAPILARPAGPVERAVKWARRKPAWAALAATVFLALILLSGGVVLLLDVIADEATQRRLAQENEARATAAQKLAQENEAHAERNFWEAKKAVDQSFRTVTEQKLFQSKQMSAARKLLLQQALPFYQAFLAERGQDPTLLRETANTHHRIGNILREIDSKADALSHLQQAHDILQKLASAQPKEFALSMELATVRNDLGQQFRELGRYQEGQDLLALAVKNLQAWHTQRPEDPQVADRFAGALLSLAHLQHAQGVNGLATSNCNVAGKVWAKLREAYPQEEEYLARHGDCKNLGAQLRATRGAHLSAIRDWREAVQIYERLRKLNPGKPEYQAVAAVIYVNLGQALTNYGIQQNKAESIQHARDQYRAALALYEQLTKDYPQVTEYHANLAATLLNLGSLQHQMKQYPEATESYTTALKKWDRLRDQHPEVLQYLRYRGAAQYNLGTVALDQGQDSVAHHWREQAEQTLQEVYRKQPQDMEVRRYLAAIHAARAQTLAKQGLFAEAAKEWERIVPLADASESFWHYLLDHVRFQLRVGDASAERALAAWVPSMMKAPHGCYALARGYALVYEATTDPQQQDRLAAQVLHWLRQAEQQHYFRIDDRVKQFNLNPTLAPLRQRPEFQLFLQQLSAPPA